MNNIKYYYNVSKGKLDNCYEFLTGELKANKSKTNIIKEHFVNGGCYEENLIYLDFYYTTDELLCGGQEYINEKRELFFKENHYYPSMWFDLEYIEVPQDFYNQIIKDKSE